MFVDPRIELRTIEHHTQPYAIAQQDRRGSPGEGGESRTQGDVEERRRTSWQHWANGHQAPVDQLADADPDGKVNIRIHMEDPALAAAADDPDRRRRALQQRNIADPDYTDKLQAELVLIRADVRPTAP